MQYTQIDTALGFLEDDTTLVLQAPFYRDISKVQNYVIERLGHPLKVTDNCFIYDKMRVIKFECIQDECCGMDQNTLTFLIDREDPKSYMECLEYANDVKAKIRNIEFGVLP